MRRSQPDGVRRGNFKPGWQGGIQSPLTVYVTRRRVRKMGEYGQRLRVSVKQRSLMQSRVTPERQDSPDGLQNVRIRGESVGSEAAAERTSEFNIGVYPWSLVR